MIYDCPKHNAVGTTPDERGCPDCEIEKLKAMLEQERLTLQPKDIVMVKLKHELPFTMVHAVKKMMIEEISAHVGFPVLVLILLPGVEVEVLRPKVVDGESVAALTDMG